MKRPDMFVNKSNRPPSNDYYGHWNEKPSGWVVKGMLITVLLYMWIMCQYRPVSEPPSGIFCPFYVLHIVWVHRGIKIILNRVCYFGF